MTLSFSLRPRPALWKLKQGTPGTSRDASSHRPDPLCVLLSSFEELPRRQGLPLQFVMRREHRLMLQASYNIFV